MKMSVEDQTLASKCLDICQALVTQGKEFSFSLRIRSTFNFSLDTRKETSSIPIERKKQSPSTLRRNSKRKAEYEKSKYIKETEDTFNCENCQEPMKNEKSLNQHMEFCEVCNEKIAKNEGCLSEHLYNHIE